MLHAFVACRIGVNRRSPLGRKGVLNTVDPKRGLMPTSSKALPFRCDVKGNDMRAFTVLLSLRLMSAVATLGYLRDGAEMQEA